MSNRHDIIVIGAGTVGVCCALSLQREGHSVILLDRSTPASGCSFGNAGIIQVGGVVPVATSGVLRQVPRMLLDPEGPLYIRWRHLPTLLPYLARFVASARQDRVEATSKVLAGILEHAIPSYRKLIEAASAQSLIRENGELYVYQSDAAFAAAQSAHDLRRRRGVRLEPVPLGELKRLEPALAPIIRHAVLFPDCISTIDPAALTVALADLFRREGGTFVQEELLEIEINGDASIVLSTSMGKRIAAKIVLATGAHSKRWAARLGARIPLDTERGYHVMLPEPGVNLDHAVVFGDQRVGLSSMPGGLRIAGTAELASLDAAPNYARATRLIPIAKRLLPDLNTNAPKPWMGHRPSTPDSLPVIGQSPRSPHAIFAFGHGHLGLTMGAITGGLVADLVANRSSVIDLAPFRSKRFLFS